MIDDAAAGWKPLCAPETLLVHWWSRRGSQPGHWAEWAPVRRHLAGQRRSAGRAPPLRRRDVELGMIAGPQVAEEALQDAGLRLIGVGLGTSGNGTLHLR